MNSKELFLELLVSMTPEDIDTFIKQNGKKPKKLSPITFVR